MFLFELKKILTAKAKALAVLVILSYQQVFASLFGMGGACRFEPSCSEYAKQCYENLDFFNATKRTVLRILKCHPFSSYGVDPAPRGLKHE